LRGIGRINELNPDFTVLHSHLWNALRARAKPVDAIQLHNQMQLLVAYQNFYQFRIPM
jgi:hypothetical protein